MEAKIRNTYVEYLGRGTSSALLLKLRKKFNGNSDAHVSLSSFEAPSTACWQQMQKYEFSLDCVYDAGTQTKDLYEVIAKELVPWIWAGGVRTLFAYGQRGSGKT